MKKFFLRLKGCILSEMGRLAILVQKSAEGRFRAGDHTPAAAKYLLGQVRTAVLTLQES